MLIAFVAGTVLAASPVPTAGPAALPSAPQADAAPVPAIVLVQSESPDTGRGAGEPPGTARQLPGAGRMPAVEDPRTGTVPEQQVPPLQVQPRDERPPETVTNTLGGGRPAADQYRAEQLIGMPVETADGERIGDVDDLILDIRNGTIDTLVVGAGGGPLGMGETQYAVEWPHVRVDQRSGRVLLALTAEQVRTAPEFRARQQR